MLAATPAALWMFFGLGIPWSLALLPRKDWPDRILVVCLALLIGPALMTAWMFVLGTFATLRLDWILGGSAVMAAAGGVFTWRKTLTQTPPPDPLPRHGEGGETRLAWCEKLVVGLIGVALIVRWLGVAYWPETAYDGLWVYGYEGRLYTLLGSIPAKIGYYPQFVPLQYTYLQLAVGGVNDHAARAALPWLQFGCILAVYVLASRLFNRQTGIIAAALWALYPHVGEWSRYGDLEIPVTFSFTLAAAFFLIAWTGQEPRRRYAALAGIALGVALWTKPTAGAFVWGVLLLLALDLLRWRLDWHAWRPRLETAVITGLAAAPLGGVWYLRNILVGQQPIVLPPGFWQTLAARSGAEFGWPLLALLVLLAYLYFGRRKSRPDCWRGLAGLALILAGLMPSVINPHRMGIFEWLALAAGAALLWMTLTTYARDKWTEETRALAAKIGWALALALPYFITWFYSYSYHFRLSFAIVPLMLLPTAVILGRWINPTPGPSPYMERGERRASLVKRVGIVGLIVLAAIPGIIVPLHDDNAGWNWLWTNKLPDDFARYRSGNAALMDVVQGLQDFVDQHPGQPLVVSAPGVKRLPFFFPLADIRVDQTPTRLSDLDGVDYFIYSKPEGTGSYENIPLQQDQVLSALARASHRARTPDPTAIMRFAWGQDDGIFKYEVYELHLERRFVPLQPNNAVDQQVVIGGFARFLGDDIGGLEFWPGRKIGIHLDWQALAPASHDYMIYIHLRDQNDHLWATWDGPVAKPGEDRFTYSTLVWESGEYIDDERTLQLQDPNTPVGDGYRIVIGMYDLQTNERVPVAVDGQPAGDGYTLTERVQVTAPR